MLRNVFNKFVFVLFLLVLIEFFFSPVSLLNMQSTYWFPNSHTDANTCSRTCCIGQDLKTINAKYKINWNIKLNGNLWYTQSNQFEWMWWYMQMQWFFYQLNRENSYFCFHFIHSLFFGIKYDMNINLC